MRSARQRYVRETEAPLLQADGEDGVVSSNPNELSSGGVFGKFALIFSVEVFATFISVIACLLFLGVSQKLGDTTATENYDPQNYLLAAAFFGTLAVAIPAIFSLSFTSLTPIANPALTFFLVMTGKFTGDDKLNTMGRWATRALQLVVRLSGQFLGMVIAGLSARSLYTEMGLDRSDMRVHATGDYGSGHVFGVVLFFLVSCYLVFHMCFRKYVFDLSYYTDTEGALSRRNDVKRGLKARTGAFVMYGVLSVLTLIIIAPVGLNGITNPAVVLTGGMFGENAGVATHSKFLVYGTSFTAALIAWALAFALELYHHRSDSDVLETTAAAFIAARAK